MAVYDTMQAVFDRVWDHFITKGNPPGFDHAEHKCVYRQGNLQCAIGCCIPDSTRYRDLHAFGGSIRTLFEEFPAQAKEIFDDLPLDFLADLQDAHDESCRINGELRAFHGAFKDCLTLLAGNYDLKEPSMT